jgi:response regulator RpfG family c-di-GMP phosphodiesterase
MAETSKTVNYTPEMTAEMVEMYVGQKMTVEAIAEKVGKSVRSVVAKLSREKVYVAKVRTSKTGEPVVRKNELADAIGAVLQLTESEISGLAGSPKTALQKIFSALANSKPL